MGSRSYLDAGGTGALWDMSECSLEQDRDPVLTTYINTCCIASAQRYWLNG